MIDSVVLFDKFLSSIATARSAPVVCGFHAAFESWFLVELIQDLRELGWTYDKIETKYYYPNSKSKADLCVDSEQDNRIVFELKSFVKDEVANKMKRYPEQIERLERLFRDGKAQQVITLTTFIGYREDEIKRLVERFFKEDFWGIIGPGKPVKHYQLYVAVASAPKEKRLSARGG